MWQAPHIKVPSVDKKEKAAATQASAAAPEEGAPEESSAATGGGAAELTPEVLGMELLVGKVIKCEKHSDADKLYAETVDHGEPGGLPDHLQRPRPVHVRSRHRRQERRRRRQPQAAKDGGARVRGHAAVREQRRGRGREEGGAAVGAGWGCRGGEATWGDAANDPPHGGNKIAKKRIWEAVQPDLGVNGACEAGWRGVVLTSSAGPVKCASIKDGGVS